MTINRGEIRFYNKYNAMIQESEFQKMAGLVDYLKAVPYDVTRTALYSALELYRGYDKNDDSSFATCYDKMTYDHYIAQGKQSTNVEEMLARTLHDHGMHLALNAFFESFSSRRCVGIMGGHALSRTDAMYREIVLLSKRLTEEGFYMLSGGGPGAMEATHLGAWLAGRGESAVEEALEMLSIAPSFRDAGWLSSAFEVLYKYPQQKYMSLAIPTWLYGHEPTTVFATHIAKFFENSIREDSILTLAYGGIIYTPGSAGTVQEVFQDAVQNHYLSFGFSSPMIFLGKEFWTQKMPVYPLLEQLMQTGMYKNLLLTLTDDADVVVEQLVKFGTELE